MDAYSPTVQRRQSVQFPSPKVKLIQGSNQNNGNVGGVTKYFGTKARASSANSAARRSSSGKPNGETPVNSLFYMQQQQKSLNVISEQENLPRVIGCYTGDSVNSSGKINFDSMRTFELMSSSGGGRILNPQRSPYLPENTGTMSSNAGINGNSTGNSVTNGLNNNNITSLVYSQQRAQSALSIRPNSASVISHLTNAGVVNNNYNSNYAFGSNGIAIGSSASALAAAIAASGGTAVAASGLNNNNYNTGSNTNSATSNHYINHTNSFLLVRPNSGNSNTNNGASAAAGKYNNLFSRHGSSSSGGGGGEDSNSGTAMNGGSNDVLAATEAMSLQQQQFIQQQQLQQQLQQGVSVQSILTVKVNPHSNMSSPSSALTSPIGYKTALNGSNKRGGCAATTPTAQYINNKKNNSIGSSSGSGKSVSFASPLITSCVPLANPFLFPANSLKNTNSGNTSRNITPPPVGMTTASNHATTSAAAGTLTVTSSKATAAASGNTISPRPIKNGSTVATTSNNTAGSSNASNTAAATGGGGTISPTNSGAIVSNRFTATSIGTTVKPQPVGSYNNTTAATSSTSPSTITTNNETDANNITKSGNSTSQIPVKPPLFTSSVPNNSNNNSAAGAVRFVPAATPYNSNAGSNSYITNNSSNANSYIIAGSNTNNATTAVVGNNNHSMGIAHQYRPVSANNVSINNGSNNSNNNNNGSTASARGTSAVRTSPTNYGAALTNSNNNNNSIAAPNTAFSIVSGSNNDNKNHSFNSDNTGISVQLGYSKNISDSNTSTAPTLFSSSEISTSKQQQQSVQSKLPLLQSLQRTNSPAVLSGGNMMMLQLESRSNSFTNQLTSPSSSGSSALTVTTSTGVVARSSPPVTTIESSLNGEEGTTATALSPSLSTTTNTTAMSKIRSSISGSADEDLSISAISITAAPSPLMTGKGSHSKNTDAATGKGNNNNITSGVDNNLSSINSSARKGSNGSINSLSSSLGSAPAAAAVVTANNASLISKPPPASSVSPVPTIGVGNSNKNTKKTRPQRPSLSDQLAQIGAQAASITTDIRARNPQESFLSASLNSAISMGRNMGAIYLNSNTNSSSSSSNENSASASTNIAAASSSSALFSMPAKCFSIGSITCKYPAPVFFYADRCEYAFNHPYEASVIDMTMYYRDMQAINTVGTKFRFKLPRKMAHFLGDFDPQNHMHMITLELTTTSSINTIREKVIPLIGQQKQ